MTDNLSKQLKKSYYERHIPIMAHWEVTYGCNLRCEHCYAASEEKGKELSLEQIAHVARQLREIGTLKVVLSGGDPFFRTDIMEIIELLRKDFFVIILSNAALIDSARAERLKWLNVTQIEVSLYAMDSTVHDSITRVKGSHEKTIAGISRLKENGVEVVVKCPVMKQNISEYPKIVKFAADMDIRMKGSPLIIPRLNGSKDTHAYCLENKELVRYFSNWFSDRDNKTEFNSSGMPVLDDINMDSSICNAGNTICSITPDGYIKPCTVLPLKMGNLIEKSIKELWQDKPAKFLKEIRNARLDDLFKCKKCSKLPLCSFCPGSNWLNTGNIFDPGEGPCNTKMVLIDEIIRHVKPEKASIANRN